MPTEEVAVTEQGDGRAYFTILPNIVDDMSLSPFAFRLYVHLKRVCGDGADGRCFQRADTLAAHCAMSKASISRAKQELVQAGLIRIEKAHSPGHPEAHDEITLIDLWPQNMAALQAARERKQVRNDVSPPGTAVGSDRTNAGPVSVLKKNPLKEEPSIKKRESDPPTPTPLQIFVKITGFKPEAVLVQNIVTVLFGATEADVLPYFQAWVTRGYRKHNLGWLFEWFAQRYIPPPNGNGHAPRDKLAMIRESDRIFEEWRHGERAVDT